MGISQAGQGFRGQGAIFAFASNLARAGALAITVGMIAGCATTHGGHRLQPEPLRTIGVAAVALGAALDLHSHEGKPAVRRLGPEAFLDNRLTWLGQSSFLLTIGGKAILLDPMFSDRPQLPVPMHPHRISPVPPGIEKLRRLDAVVVSHADHDHLDLPTLRRLAKKFPGAHLYVPQGTEDIAAQSGFATRTHLPPFGTRRQGTVSFTTLPAYHMARRDMIGLNRRSAAGWEIAAGGYRIYFSGDTGYGPAFREIRARRGRYDLALVPIGAYAPESLYNHIHTTPEDGLAIAADLGAPVAVGHHWGTFAFGREARERFLAASVPGVTARAPDIGETMRLP